MIKSIAHDQSQKNFKYLWLDFRLPIFDYESKHMDENLFKRRTKQLALRENCGKFIQEPDSGRTREAVDSIRHFDRR